MTTAKTLDLVRGVPIRLMVKTVTNPDRFRRVFVETWNQLPSGAREVLTVDGCTSLSKPQEWLPFTVRGSGTREGLPRKGLQQGCCISVSRLELEGSGRSTRLKARAEPGGVNQRRFNRPRPAVCSSATTSDRSGAPASAQRAASSLVEPIRPCTSRPAARLRRQPAR